MDEPERALDQGADWVVVVEAAGLAQAELFAGSLRAAGIPTWIDFESAGAAIGVSVGALGRIWVLVPPEHEDDARALLAGELGADVDMIDGDEGFYYLDEDGNPQLFEPGEDDAIK